MCYCRTLPATDIRCEKRIYSNVKRLSHSDWKTVRKSDVHYEHDNQQTIDLRTRVPSQVVEIWKREPLIKQESSWAQTRFGLVKT